MPPGHVRSSGTLDLGQQNQAKTKGAAMVRAAAKAKHQVAGELMHACAAGLNAWS